MACHAYTAHKNHDISPLTYSFEKAPCFTRNHFSTCHFFKSSSANLLRDPDGILAHCKNDAFWHAMNGRVFEEQHAFVGCNTIVCGSKVAEIRHVSN